MRFTESTAWKKLAAKLQEQLENCRDAAIEAKTFDEKEYNRGWYHALRSVLELPAQILKEESGEAEIPETAAEQKVAIRAMPSAPSRRLSGRF